MIQALAIVLLASWTVFAVHAGRSGRRSLEEVVAVSFCQTVIAAGLGIIIAFLLFAALGGLSK